MPKFLTTVGNSFHIEQIIIKAQKELTLVTPYLNLSTNILERLKDANKSGVKITFIYGKSKLTNAEKKKIESLNNVEIYFCQNLHAKCYFNEFSMIISSMNLYEFSERNNREIGILIDKNDDPVIYKDCATEIESIKNSSKLEKALVMKDREFEKEKVNLDDLIFFSDNLFEKWNFYLPSLYRVLKANNTGVHPIFAKKLRIIIKNTPINGVSINVDGRIDYNFNSDVFYYYLKEKFRDRIENSNKQIRFYWNRNSINIYLEKEYEILVSEKGLKDIVFKKLRVISETNNHIKEAEKLFTF